MKAPFRRVVFVAGLVCVPGCNLLVLRGRTPDVLPKTPDSRSASTDQSSGAIEAYGLKPVNGKEEPTTLIARDGTSCTVSKDKYDSAKIGRAAWCTWIDRRR